MKCIKPTKSELEILVILWKYGPSTVKYVNSEIRKHKNSGYTTTLKLMQIMFEKELLVRERNGKSHIYAASYNPDEIRGIILEDVLEKAFEGSVSKLVLHALNRDKTSIDEFNEIRDYLLKYDKAKQ